jgi:hypothetical protein
MSLSKTRTRNKKNDRALDTKITTAYEENNPAWQSNSKVGTRVRVYNNDASYTWKYKNSTGGLEKKDLKREIIKGYKGKFNRTNGLVVKRRIKSKLASNSAKNKNEWVKFVKSAQNYWLLKFKTEKTYPCIMSDPIAQLMYHAKERSSSSAVSNPFDPRYYPFITLKEVEDEFARNGESLEKTSSHFKILQFNPFDTLEGNSIFRDTIANKFDSAPLEISEDIVVDISPVVLDTRKRKSNKMDVSAPSAITTSAIDNGTLVENLNYKKILEMIRKPLNLEPSVYLRDVGAKRGIFQNIEETIDVLPTFEEAFFSQNGLQSLWNVNEDFEKNYQNWLHIEIIHAFCVDINQFILQKYNQNECVIAPSVWNQIFSGKNYNSNKKMENLMKTCSTWLIVPVQNVGNEHWYVIRVSFRSTKDSLLQFKVIVYDSLYSHKKINPQHVLNYQDIVDFIFYLFRNQFVTIENTYIELGYIFGYDEEEEFFKDEEMSRDQRMNLFPKQKDGSSCGIFTLLFLLNMVIPKPISWNSLSTLTKSKLIEARLLLAEYIIRKYRFLTDTENRRKRRATASGPTDISMVMDVTEDSISSINTPLNRNKSTSTKNKSKVKEIKKSTQKRKNEKKEKRTQLPPRKARSSRKSRAEFLEFIKQNT